MEQSKPSKAMPRRASLLLLLALSPPPTSASSAASIKRRDRTTSASRRRRRGQPVSVAKATRLDVDSRESLRDRWVDILSLEQNDSNSVRLENRHEQQYYYEAEVLADKLLGIHDNHEQQSSLGRNSSNKSLLSKELSVLWKSIALASSGILIGIPVAAIFNSLVTSELVQSLLSWAQSSITPYLVPTFSLVTSSVSNYVLQLQAIVHSMPYLLRHLNRVRIKPGPFLYKLIRKCIILEAWRHIWLRVYKLTKYLWKGTLKNAKSAYLRLCPAWIRRGVKSTFQSMVQAHVHGVVGGALGSALSGVTFESWAWSGGGGDGVDPSSVAVSETVDSIKDAAESLSESAAQGLQNTVQNAVDSMASDGVMETMTDVVESIAEDAADAMAESADALSESVGSAIEEAIESISTEDAVEAIVEGVESSIEDAVESMVEDCLSEGCLDQVAEGVLD